MRKIVIVIVLSVFLNGIALAGIIPPVRKTAETDKVNIFNKITDSMATVGKDPREKRQILQERKEDRRFIRSRAIDRKNRTKTKSKIKREQQSILEKLPQGRTSVGL